MTRGFARQAVVGQGASSLLTPPAGLSANVLITNVAVGAGARTGPYYPGPGCTSVMVVATGTCKFQMRGNAGDGPAITVYRDCVMSAEQQTATATKIGILDGTSIPYEFYLFDTSGSTNPVSMYVTYA